jgi:amidohydrolase
LADEHDAPLLPPEWGGPQDPDLVALRRRLHRSPELSNQEEGTAAVIAEFLEPLEPSRLYRSVGGHGLVAIYEGRSPGLTLLLRADLDALPIAESLELRHGSELPGVSHKCGHDGHMTILAGVAQLLHASPPPTGRVVLLFQPAEETGEGAARVIADPIFKTLEPDRAFALHNLPGFPLGSVVLREGTFASASRGLIIRLNGATSHAAEPARGRSPALAVAALINELSALPQLCTRLEQVAQATVIHARLGERAFGTSPGQATVMATLRAHDEAVIDTLALRAEERAAATAMAHDLELELEWTEVFPPTVNAPAAVATVTAAAARLGLELSRPAGPFAWSEDFGRLASRFSGALVGLGAGLEHPALHSPGYDFPEPLIEVGRRLLYGIIEQSLGIV